MDIVQRYKELRRMGVCETRAKVQAATEQARSVGGYVSKSMEDLEQALLTAHNVPTRPGGLL